MAAGSNTVSLTEYELLEDNQCPLPPRKFTYINDENERCSVKTTAWFYKDRFWIKERETNKIYPVILAPKELKKYSARVKQMRVVDEYIGAFGLTTSVQIYKMLTISVNKDALTLRTKGALSATKLPTNASLYAKKFTPNAWNRVGFLTVILRALLNAYFIITNFLTINAVPTNFWIFVLIIVCIEALLWVIAFSRTLYNVYSLLKRMCSGSTTHFQVKNVPENLRQLASLSVMRYLPNGESLLMFRKRGKEWFSEKKASFKFQVSNATTFKYLVVLRWFILSVLDIIGPFVAVFSLLFKMAQLNFQFDALNEWRWFEIVGYFAFVNQVAGIRKVRKIEIEALQHFIFSGSDIKLSQEENLLLEVWWNYTMVSCVANICDEFKYPVYDSILFWYNLNVRRIQLLFKDHKGLEGSQFITKKGKNIKDNTKKYDIEIQQQINNNKQVPAINIIAQQSNGSENESNDSDKDLNVANVKQKTNKDYVDVPVHIEEEEQEQKDEP